MIFCAKKICFPNFLLRAKEFHVCVQQRLFAILLRFTISYSPPTVIRMINYYTPYPKIRKFWHCYYSTQFIISLRVILSAIKTLRWYQSFLTLCWSQLTDQKMVFIVESLFIWSLHINPWMTHIVSKTAKDNEEVGVFQVKTIPILVVHCISLPRIV